MLVLFGLHAAVCEEIADYWDQNEIFASSNRSFEFITLYDSFLTIILVWRFVFTDKKKQ